MATERLLGARRSLMGDAADAAEWLLDNEHVVERALAHVQEVLTPGFLNDLPKLSGVPLDGEPRVYAVAQEVTQGGDADPDRARSFLEAFSPRPGLTMGEIWALPVMLRLVLLERLAAAAGPLRGPSTEPAQDAWRALWRVAPEPLPLDEVGTCVRSLQALASVDWRAFFESVSRVHAVLSEDPAGFYTQMDFHTREAYREAIEGLARRAAGQEEEEIARTAVRLCLESSGDARARHVGYNLVDRGRPALEARIGFRPRLLQRLARRLRPKAPALYIAVILLVAAALMVLLVGAAAIWGHRWHPLLLAAVGGIPAVSLAVAIVNWGLTHALPPRVLPKLSLEDGVGDDLATAVVVPALIAGRADVEAVLHRLELNHQGNAASSTRFILLADLADAPQRDMTEDVTLLRLLDCGVAALNEGAAGAPFFLLYRGRRWNAAEGCWMGWERKRGKLMELNALLLGGESELQVRVGARERLRGIRYVVTLDADTFLPVGAARRLVGALAHPLNRAVFDAAGRVIAGYTVVQPRVEIFPSNANESPFARIFQGERGVDLYTHAASDVYQDLFGEGSYAGKGIYDVAAFERSLAGRVPDNTLLSHDLFEGLCGRAALASDIVVFESFPSHVLAYLRRLHRWVRGDWQLLPWLLPRVPGGPGGREPNRFTLLARWKIVDNLRRSLRDATLLLMLLVGWVVVPAAAVAVTAAALLLLAAPVFLSAATEGRRQVRARRRRLVSLRPSGVIVVSVERALVALVLLPVQAVVQTDAVIRTLIRLRTRRHLLEWTTAAHTGQTLVRRGGSGDFVREMVAAPLLAIGLGILAVQAGTLGLAWPLLAAWAVSPLVASRLSQSAPAVAVRLTSDDRRLLRVLARRTWGFFERVVGPEDHWLPPDHVQEEPYQLRAHRTSPTNTGLFMAAVLVARDLGYVPLIRMSALLDSVLDTLGELERYRGHFLNWFDTHDLGSLEPRYVSTVDSGNLAASLLAVSSACAEAPARPIPSPALAEGLCDTLSVLEDLLRAPVWPRNALAPLLERLASMRTALSGPADPLLWARGLADLERDALPVFEQELVTIVERGAGRLDADSLAELGQWTAILASQVEAQRNEVELLLPWLDLPEDPPAALSGGGTNAALREGWRAVLREAGAALTLSGIDDRTAELKRLLGPLVKAAASATGATGAPTPAAGTLWAEGFFERLDAAAAAARGTSAELADVAGRAEALVREMDFSFLYNREREIFHIGFNVSAGQIDGSFYDLLASEARLASLIAIGKGDAPARHWLHLGRPFRRTRGGAVLLSWGGSMFEYLLPSLFLPAPASALLGRAGREAVQEQIRFAQRNGIPWGISESGYADVDAHGTYQYRAFGVPALALRRGAGDRLVVAPYAAALALSLSARAAVLDLRRLMGLGGSGRFGLHEAVDFGPSESRTFGPPKAVVEYMAHHQAMILLAVGESLGSPLVERLRSRKELAALEFLLHEEMPSLGLLEPLSRRTVVPAVTAPPPHVTPWTVDATAPERRALVLSNGSFSTLVTGRGDGGMQWKGRALTRWRVGALPSRSGVWVYIRDEATGHLWSPTAAPTFVDGEPAEVAFSPHAVTFHRRHDGISSRLEIAVAPDAPVEARRLSLLNESERPRRLLSASCGEVVLAGAAEDRRHPAYSKLFVEVEPGAGGTALFFSRRTPSITDETTHLVHACVAPRAARPVGWEADRARFLGRNGSYRLPRGLAAGGSLQGVPGAPLDPIFVLAHELVLRPGQEAVLTYLTAAGTSGPELRGHLDSFATHGRIGWLFDQARRRSERQLHRLGIAPRDAPIVERLLSRLLFPLHARADTPVAAGPAAAGPLQQGLWALGVSGDLPVLLLRVPPEGGSRPLMELVVRAHAFWRRAGVRADLVVLDEAPGGYAEPFRDWLLALLDSIGSRGWLNAPAGVFHVPADRLAPEHRAAVRAAASLRIEAGGRALEEQLAVPARSELPAFVPVTSGPPTSAGTPPLERPSGLLFDNGLGGFSADGREYVLHLDTGEATPAPWINVIANPDFGFTVSEAGAGFTWAGNSQERRLTPWTNDPVTDVPGEVLYLRDEETATVWSPTPRPAPDDGAYQVRHGTGWTSFLHRSQGLAQEVLLFSAPADPAKVARLRLENLWQRPRRITVTYYVEWVLGTDRRDTAPHITTELEPETGAILAQQDFHAETLNVCAFLASSEPVHGATGDRTEFLGREGAVHDPAALRRIGLAGTFGRGLDPCAALQVHVDLAAGESRTLHFVLGAAADRGAALDLVRRYREPAAISEALRASRERWDGILERVRVNTPEPAMDLLLNGWLSYQALSCRIWGRSALYQSSGAFGFRDQLQDVGAFLLAAPGIAREHILHAAARQFAAGDVLHWWHPPSGRGVRTRCSDDLLWLPFMTAAYIEATGDADILQQTIPYLEGVELGPTERERFDRYDPGSDAVSLYDHCIRALRRGTTRGAHGLPLIGASDWNDAMDRVGEAGRGESVWLAWFLHAALTRFAPFSRHLGKDDDARRLEAAAAAVKAAVEDAGWDGQWYRRAYFDDGTPLGSSTCREGCIDSLTQSWAVLSGGADPQRARTAMESVLRELVDADDRLVLLLAPPFDRALPSPGYIRAYPPGVRENGGQYTHAAAWVVCAMAALGEGDRAEELFRLLNPILRVTDRASAERYRVEPYVVAGDIYGAEQHAGRGGWTWYTGSAGWLYRAGMEWILGVRPRPGGLLVDPCIPKGWQEFEVRYRVGAATWVIRVRNPGAVSRGVVARRLDGAPLEGELIPVRDDGREHLAEVILGSALPSTAPTDVAGAPGAEPEARVSRSP